MMPAGIQLFLTVWLIAFLGSGVVVTAQSAVEKGAAESGRVKPPPFEEVYELVRTNVAGLSEAEFNRKAVDALVRAFEPKVSYVRAANAAPGALPILKTEVFERDIAYLRVGQVSSGLAKALQEGLQRLNATNKIKGVVLDLRFAGGNDYAAAAQTADLFIRKEQPLLRWSQETAKATSKANAITLPVAVLVNHETASAAEALAAVLRNTGAALILGTQTAGQANEATEFKLSNGEKLRVATTPVRFGDGTPLPAAGITPDIVVTVAGADERAYYADAFTMVVNSNQVAGTNGAGTNRAARRPRFGEAELERERREGVSSELELTAREAEPEKPMIYDPALARAIDVLKGLAVVRQSRS